METHAGVRDLLQLRVGGWVGQVHKHSGGIYLVCIIWGQHVRLSSP